LVCAEVNGYIKDLVQNTNKFQAQIKFRELKDYKNFWPVVDILKTMLKCTSECAHKQVTNIFAERTKAKLIFSISQLLTTVQQIVKRRSKGKVDPDVGRDVVLG